VRDELQQQSMSNATVRNIITSLRLTAGMDWTDFFERVSLVDAALAGSVPAGMDFPTRNLYRTAIEGLARGSGQAELDIARGAVARAAGHGGGQQGDPGYYLIGGGRPGFEAAMGYRVPLRARLERGCRSVGIGGYGGIVIALAAAFLAVPLRFAAEAGTASLMLVLLAAAGFVLASDAAVACVNRLATWAFGATTLPGLHLEDGIPAPFRTLVAVPTMLTSAAGVADQVARLEMRPVAGRHGAGRVPP